MSYGLGRGCRRYVRLKGRGGAGKLIMMRNLHLVHDSTGVKAVGT